MHPVRFPQSMFQDYKNIFGKGHRALLKSSPQKKFYLYVHPSIEEWLKRHIDYTDKGFFQCDSMGKISYFYDLEIIYKDYIKNNLNNSQSLIKKTSEKKGIDELPMDKCCSVSIQDGLLI